MRRKLSIKIILQALPTYAVRGSYLYRRDFQHIIGGFLFEPGSGGYYPWKFALPLYDGNIAPHLTFGDRIHEPVNFISETEIQNGDGEQIALKIIEENEPWVFDIMEPDGYINSMWIHGRDNIFSSFSIVCSWIVTGEFSLALSALDGLKVDDRLFRYPDLMQRVNELSSCMNRGPDFARNQLTLWEKLAKPYWS